MTESRRQRRSTSAVVAFVTFVASIAMAATSCAFLPDPLPARTAPSAGGPPCAEAATRSCALPYPSDEFTVPDPSTPTGRRVEFPDRLVPASLLEQLGPGAGTEDAFSGADGFASLSPVIFELERSVDPNSLPDGGGDLLAVFDLATGEPVDVRVELSIDALFHGGINTILMAWPTVRWEPGHTYVARVHRGLRANFGELAPAPGISHPGEYLASIRTQLRDLEGDRWSEVIAATRFTIRSRENAAGDLEEMAATARAEDHPVRNLTVSPPYLLTDSSAIVQGEVLLSDFRDDDGVAAPEHGPTPGWERFFMVLPAAPASPAGAPVVVYGHGLLISKESLLAVASTNSRFGMATVGVDVPNHGDRQGDEGGYLTDLAVPGKLGRLASMPLQGVVDNVSMIRSVVQHFGELELDPWNPVFGLQPPRLDTSRIFYEGTSMGSVLGAAEVALSPDLDGAFLQVGGAGIADIIYHSMLWPLFAPVIPYGASAGDAAALQGAATMLLDRGDSVNVLDRVRDGQVPMVLQYGVGDGIVPNFSSDRLMSLAGLPLIGPDLTPVKTAVPRLPTDTIPADGRAAQQTWNSASSLDTMAFQAHLSFSDPTALALLDQWIRNRLTATGLPPT